MRRAFDSRLCPSISLSIATVSTKLARRERISSPLPRDAWDERVVRGKSANQKAARRFAELLIALAARWQSVAKGIRKLLQLAALSVRDKCRSLSALAGQRN
jgi:hypothetical protein